MFLRHLSIRGIDVGFGLADSNALGRSASTVTRKIRHGLRFLLASTCASIVLRTIETSVSTSPLCDLPTSIVCSLP